MRTFDEIVEYCKKVDGFLDFRAEAVAVFLSADRLDEVGFKAEHPDEYEPRPLTEESIIERMRDYMDFAWDKANGERGLSAGRSVQKFSAWCWLLGNDELAEYCMGDDYEPYGKPILRKVCETYGFEIKG